MEPKLRSLRMALVLQEGWLIKLVEKSIKKASI
jgi:hypothetical protein